MKFPLSWHAECLHNFERSLKEDEQYIQHLQNKLDRNKKKLEEEKAQYTLAVSRGLKEYDPDRFGKGKK